MVPLIAVVGCKSSGKTSLLVSLTKEIIRRGYQVGMIKHDVHGFEIDYPQKDSYKLKEAGAKVVIISSGKKAALIKDVPREMSLDELNLRYLDGEVDIVLTEGYKKTDKKKIEVYREGISEKLLSEEKELLFLVSDKKFDLNVPIFNFQETNKMADYLENNFLIPKRVSSVDLIIDGKKIPLNIFAEDIIKKTIQGMTSSLKGVGKAKKINIQIKTTDRRPKTKD